MRIRSNRSGHAIQFACLLGLAGCGGGPENDVVSPPVGEVTATNMNGMGAPAVQQMANQQQEMTQGAAPVQMTAPAATTTVQQAEAIPDFLIDDFSDGDATLSAQGLQGSWVTYSDGSGQVQPPVDSAITPVGSQISVVGSGFSVWGVGLTVNLNADVNVAGGQRQAVNLQQYESLKVRASGSGTIDVEFVTPGTTGTDDAGGLCTGEGCYGHYAAQINLTAEVVEHVVPFSRLSQPDWAQALAAPELDQVLAINFLSRVQDGAGGNIEFTLDSVSLVNPQPVSVATAPGMTTEPGAGAVAGGIGGNPFVGRTLYSEGGSAQAALNSAQGADRDLLAKVVQYPTAFWLVGGDPARAGAIADNAGGEYPVIVAYNIPTRDCDGASAGGATGSDDYRAWIDGMASSLQGKQAAIVLEPDALALACSEESSSLVSYAVTTLMQNPGVAVYIDAGHSNWVGAGDMAGRLRGAGIEQATGFALNVSNFEPTPALIAYGNSVSEQVGGKPFILDTSRNGRGPGSGGFCNPTGTGLGEAPTTVTAEANVHAFLWIKRPGESDGPCGACEGVNAGQFCTGYALDLARNSIF